MEFAREKLDNPFNINLEKTRFSDELHIGYGHEENRHYILRKRGRKWRYHKDCLRQKEQRTKINKKKKDNNDPDREDKEGKIVHLWYCISYNFKSKLYWYEVPTNSNRKMNSEVYMERVLSQVVKGWIDKGHDFILQEDRDSAHTSKETEAYKKKISLEYYYTPGRSPDMTAIETIALIFKAEYRKQLRTTKQQCIDAAEHAWKQISQEKINNVIRNMTTRYQKCVELDGQMTAF